MNQKRSHEELAIQSDIEADLGSEPDLLILRNAIGQATYYDDEGRVRAKVTYGLGTGSPDLVTLLRVRIPHTTIYVAVWLCFEVKVPGEGPSEDQKHTHAVWRRFGAIVEVVHSVAEARGALERTRRLFTPLAA